MHDFVIAELALGNVKDRLNFIAHLHGLPRLPTSSQREIMELLEIKKLHGAGIGFVDLHLVSACLFAGTSLLTYDKNLAQVWARCKP